MHKTYSIQAARSLWFPKTGQPEVIAPTSDALRFHLTRVHYQAIIWRPSEMGVRLGESGLQPVMMAFSVIPVS